MSTPIIVGFDGSESAHKALDFAAQQAKAAQVPLHIVGVVEWSLFGIQTSLDITTINEQVNEEVQHMKVDLIEPAAARLRSEGIAAEGHVAQGNIASVLCEIAAHEKASCIIVGRRGHGRMQDLLFGSTSFALAQQSKVPITLVP